MDSRNSESSSEAPASAHNAASEPFEGDASEAASIAYLAEAMESKHRVRQRLARVLARSVEGSAVGHPIVGDALVGQSVVGNDDGDARGFDPDAEHSPVPSPGMSLEGNPLGEYLLNCELQRRPFTL